MKLSEKQLKSFFKNPNQVSDMFVLSEKERIKSSIKIHSAMLDSQAIENHWTFTAWKTVTTSVMAVFVVFLTISGIANNSLPGDMLYSVKIFGEKLALSWQQSPLSEAGYHARLAQTRMSEMENLIERIKLQNIANTENINQLTRLSLNITSELQNTRQALQTAVLISDKDFNKLQEIVDTTKTIREKTENLSLAIASIPTTQNTLSAFTKHNESSVNTSLSVLATAAESEKTENENKTSVKKTIREHIVKQEKKIELIEYKAALAPNVQAAQDALKKAEALVEDNKLNEAVDQLLLSDSLVKDSIKEESKETSTTENTTDNIGE